MPTVLTDLLKDLFFAQELHIWPGMIILGSVLVEIIGRSHLKRVIGLLACFISVRVSIAVFVPWWSTLLHAKTLTYPFVKGRVVVEFELFKTFSYINDLAGQFSSSHHNQMNKDGRSQIMADLQSWLSRGGAAQVKLRESEQKHRVPEVTNGILTSSQWRFTIYIVTSLWLER